MLMVWGNVENATTNHEYRLNQHSAGGLLIDEFNPTQTGRYPFETPRRWHRVKRITPDRPSLSRPPASGFFRNHAFPQWWIIRCDADFSNGPELHVFPPVLLPPHSSVKVSRMLTIFGRNSSARRRFCDGVSRRDFLTIGGMALGGISLEQTLAGGV